MRLTKSKFCPVKVVCWFYIFKMESCVCEIFMTVFRGNLFCPLKVVFCCHKGGSGVCENLMSLTRIKFCLV